MWFDQNYFDKNVSKICFYMAALLTFYHNVSFEYALFINSGQIPFILFQETETVG